MSATTPAHTHAGSHPNTRLRVLIVDDEEFNRLRLRDLLEAQSDVDVVGEAADGVEAVERIRALRPDLVFLDIRMPGLSGLDVVRQIGPESMPATVFATAYDQHAVEAFRLAALDFLVKPFDDDRFAETLQRARRLVALNDLATMRARLLDVLGTTAEPPVETPGPAGGYLERIAVEEQGTIRPIAVADIDYILASGPYAELVVAGRRHLVRESMQSLEDRLDPRRFLRIHRSVIVRLDRVEGLRRGAGGDGEVLLKGGGRLRVSRTRREALERWLGLGGQPR
ncbi:LytTR family DNA-binding domain-containing protein [Gemmatimonas aurantiaca]|uniref:LytR/AlgR family response regulator transcription factor n=1 Tax=Gemmatimonas aurantiaca TaxID=173480 RepID=UPI00301DD6B2